MNLLQERNLMTDHIGVILWEMQLLQELFYTGNQINLMKTCHNMNIIVQTTGGDAYSINGKSEISNKAIYNIRRDLLLN